METTVMPSVTPDVSVKILAVEFYKKITKTLVDASLNERDEASYRMNLRNFWVLLWCFWAAVSFSSRIDEKQRAEIKQLLENEPKNLKEARNMLYKVFEYSASAGIFVDFSMVISDYDAGVW